MEKWDNQADWMNKEGRQWMERSRQCLQDNDFGAPVTTQAWSTLSREVLHNSSPFLYSTQVNFIWSTGRQTNQLRRKSSTYPLVNWESQLNKWIYFGYNTLL